MNRFALVSACVFAIASCAWADVTGQYVEARTCDVYTGPCFANADTGLSGRHAVMAWRIDKGSINNVKLDGLSVIAVISARENLGLKQVVTGKAVLLIDDKATSQQRAALVAFAKKQGGALVENVVEIRNAPISVEVCECKGNACAKVKAGEACIETRCLDAQHDKACGNETAFYPPLAKSVKVLPAMATEHSFSGKGFNENWSERDRRGAYVGSFSIQ